MLGPLEVIDGDTRRTPSRLKERTLLALLLTNAGQPVSTAAVNHALWGDDPPASARSNLASYVTELRRALNRDGDRLVRTTGGYLLDVADSEVDARVFERLVHSGRRALKDGRPQSAVGELAAALRLWRGSPLTDIRSTDLRGEVTRLEELRLVAVEDMAEANLAAGHHEEVATALPALVEEYPLRERLWSLLMRAWYRTGRQSEALGAYQRVYRLLDDELGVEPGPELKRVHQLILNATPDVTPRQLPVDTAVFVGRDGELAELDRLAADRSVLVLTGFVGVGKTALALRWARTVADDFPDGQLYVDLRGFAGERPLSAQEAQARLLAPFGVPADQVPADPCAATALFRSVLADRRVLVVLDNASSAAQVRPLLAGTTLVTSRDTMTGLVAGEGAHRLTVSPLTLRAATEVLAGITGHEPVETVELARLCGCVPLALRVAAANLADDPARGMADYVAELVDDGLFTRLSVDGDETLDVGLSIGYSYDRLSARARGVFHALAGAAPMTLAEVAARFATTPRVARAWLTELTAGHLAVRDGGRFTVTDLPRRYARSTNPARLLMTV